MFEIYLSVALFIWIALFTQTARLVLALPTLGFAYRRGLLGCAAGGAALVSLAWPLYAWAAWRLLRRPRTNQHPKEDRCHVRNVYVPR